MAINLDSFRVGAIGVNCCLPWLPQSGKFVLSFLPYGARVDVVRQVGAMENVLSG
jgi:hypothetical protein